MAVRAFVLRPAGQTLVTVVAPLGKFLREFEELVSFLREGFYQ
jgi:hypothetical protein